jgi:hypothetical protein
MYEGGAIPQAQTRRSLGLLPLIPLFLLLLILHSSDRLLPPMLCPADPILFLQSLHHPLTSIHSVPPVHVHFQLHLHSLLRPPLLFAERLLVFQDAHLTSKVPHVAVSALQHPKHHFLHPLGLVPQPPMYHPAIWTLQRKDDGIPRLVVLHPALSQPHSYRLPCYLSMFSRQCR